MDKNRKVFPISKLIILVTILSIILGIVFFKFKSKLNSGKPPIVDHFACSDYCPGSKKKYMVKIYEGISDEKECLDLGGTPYSYTGWSTTTVCLAR